MRFEKIKGLQHKRMSFIYQIRDAASGRKFDFDDLGDEDRSLALHTMEPGMPLLVKLSNGNENYWQLPWEPLVSVNGGNVIVKRNVAKAKNFGGTIKERWAQDDWEITIEGDFMNEDSTAYPKAAVEQLKAICEAEDTVDVQHELLNSLGITRMVIQDYSFPFTTGPENQRWTVKALSDKGWELLVKEI